MVQAAWKPCWMFVDALPTCRFVHVAPPSVDVETISTCETAPALDFSWLRNSSTHRYTFPKKGLEDALSAQIWSWSSTAVELARGAAFTGGIQLDLARTLVGVGLSSRETK